MSDYIDTASTEFIICPYCGDKDDDSYDHLEEFFQEGEYDYYCGYCDKDFKLYTSVSYDYETIKELVD